MIYLWFLFGYFLIFMALAEDKLEIFSAAKWNSSLLYFSHPRALSKQFSSEDIVVEVIDEEVVVKVAAVEQDWECFLWVSSSDGLLENETFKCEMSVLLKTGNVKSNLSNCY